MSAPILVTGASGFLGCRLVERLALGERADVRALAHRSGRALRLARLPVELVFGDLRDRTSVERAVSGCRAVVHCAVAKGSDRDESHAVTVAGTRRLARLAADAGVERFVHISTIAVHSYSPPARVDEESPRIPCGDVYADHKIEAEKAVARMMRERSLAATILRMGNLYGPFSAAWTTRPLRHLRSGFVTLVDGGRHEANATFVDNAVDAILLTIADDRAVGETFFVTDDPVTWRDWYGHYARWLGGVPLHSIGSADLERLLRPSLARRLRLRIALPLWRRLRRAGPSRAVFRQLRDTVPAPARDRLTRDAVRDSLPRLPPTGLLQRYASRTRFPNDKLRRTLGYAPRTGLEEALGLTREWARWARLTAPPAERGG